MTCRTYTKAILLLGLLVLPRFIFAQESASIEEVSNNLLVPLSILADIGYKIFFIIGAGFLAASAIRYKGHRNNPNHVRFGEVLLLLFLGLGLIAMPFGIKYSEGAAILQQVSGS